MKNIRLQIDGDKPFILPKTSTRGPDSLYRMYKSNNRADVAQKVLGLNADESISMARKK